MIRVCAENGHVNKAFKLYNTSKKIGLTPTKGTLFWLLQVRIEQGYYNYTLIYMTHLVLIGVR